MTDRQTKKRDEGLAHMKKANQYAKTGVFKWKADWEGAGLEYEKAALCFKHAKDLDRALEAYLKASKAFQSDTVGVVSAAKNLDLAAGIARELKRDSEACEYLREASLLHLEMGHSEKGAEVLCRAARSVEKTDSALAIELVKDACTIYEDYNKESYSGDTFKYAIALALKTRSFDDAIELLRRNIKMYSELDNQADIYKSYLSIILIALFMNNFAKASEYYAEFVESEHAFGPSNEGMAAGKLLDSIERDDMEEYAKILGMQLFTFLDNEVVKLTKQMKTKPISSENAEELLT